MLQWYDILHQQTNLTTNVTANGWTDREVNAITSYAMLHVSYRMNFFGGNNNRGGRGGFGGGRPAAGAQAAPAAPATMKDTLEWHSVDSKLFNIKLIRFAQGTSNGQKRYGLIFNAFTVINCDQDIPNVRLSAGSNASSIWWVNGEQVLKLQADRRMVVDDGMSKRITLKKGKNIVRGAVINGPGMSDMCVRFYNEDGTILKNYTITNK